MAQGKIEVYFEDIKSKKSKTIVIQENNLVKIPPKVYHEVKGLTDFILLEFNIQGENCKKDTVENYQKKWKPFTSSPATKANSRK